MTFKSIGNLISTVKLELSGLELLFFIVISVGLIFTVFAQWRLILKKERSLLLAEFSANIVTGIKFKYEVDRDKKMELIVLENIALQNEVKALKTTNKKERITSLSVIIILFILIVIARLKIGLKK